MLKIRTQFTKTDPINQVQQKSFDTRQGSFALPSTVSFEYDSVPAEKEKPRLAGQGLEVAEYATVGNIVIPTVAGSAFNGNSHGILAAESPVKYGNSSNGFIKVMREAQELLVKDERAFKLVVFIALEAVRKKSKFSDGKLEIGQAFISGCSDLGWSDQVYRDVKHRVEFKYKLATFKGTSKGTIATLITSDVCDINIQHEERSKERAENEQGTSTTLLQEEYKKKRKRVNSLERAQDSSSYGKFVRLQASEYESLSATHGKAQLDEMIARINDHCESTGKKYVGFAATIRNWFRREQKPSVNGHASPKPAEGLVPQLRKKLPSTYGISLQFGMLEVTSGSGHSILKCEKTDISEINRFLKQRGLDEMA